MTDEENKLIEKSIEILKEFRKYNKFYKDLTITITLEAKESIDKAIERLLTAYEKEKEKNKEYKECERLSKRQLKKQKNDIETLKIEIEELEARKYMLNAETGEISQIPIDNNYISKDKIKTKIEYYEKIDNPVGVRILESLLEKE